MSFTSVKTTYMNLIHTDISLYTPPVPLFVLTSARTLLGTIILETNGVHSLYVLSIVQLYSYIVIESVYTCILSFLVYTLSLAQWQCCTNEVYTCTVEPVRYNCTLLGACSDQWEHKQDNPHEPCRPITVLTFRGPLAEDLNHSMLTTSVPIGKGTWYK